MGIPTPTERDIDLLRLGQPPENLDLLNAINVGQSIWENFIVELYLDQGGYVHAGHSQLKFLLGRSGSGKTHLLRRLAYRAQQLHYLPVLISAQELRLQHINTLYTAILRHVDLIALLDRLENRVIESLGYNPGEIPDHMTLMEWTVREKNRVHEIVKRDVQKSLETQLMQKRTDPNFSTALIQLASNRLGTHPQQPEDIETIFAWMQGERLPVAELRRVYISRSIDRYNARDMFHSFATFVRQQGYSGLFIAVDEMEDLLATDPDTRRNKYNRAALTDAYQSIRELIDELHDIPATFVILSGRVDLLLDGKRGIKSYDALWLRVQNEVYASHFNPFAQLVDLDEGVKSYLSLEEAEELFSRLRSLREAPSDKIDLQAILRAEAGDGVFRRLVREALK